MRLFSENNFIVLHAFENSPAMKFPIVISGDPSCQGARRWNGSLDTLAALQAQHLLIGP